MPSPLPHAPARAAGRAPRGAGRAWSTRLGLARRAALLRDELDPTRRAELLAAINDLLRLAVERDALGWRRTWRRVSARRRAQLDDRGERQLDVLCELASARVRPRRR